MIGIEQFNKDKADVYQSNHYVTDLDLKDFAAVVHSCKEMSVALVVVGPEDPLANGLADTLKKEGTHTSGIFYQLFQKESFSSGLKSRHAL